MHYFRVPKMWNISMGLKMMFGSVSEYFANLRQVKRCKTSVSGLNALFRGTEVVKHPFYSIRPKMMFGSVSNHFTNLGHVTRCKTCVRASMHYFTVPKSWNISIGPQMMFGSVSEYFTNLRQVKRCKTFVSGLNALIRGTEVVKHPFYSIGPKMMFGSVS
jgi:acid stress-induced BolA-like protein IbaG/YrbA